MVGFFSCFRRGSSGASNPQAFHFSPPFNDPFALPHISDRLIMPAIESNYRTKSGFGCSSFEILSDNLGSFCSSVTVGLIDRHPDGAAANCCDRGNSIEGSASPKVDANDMRRIYVHDDDRVLVKVHTAQLYHCYMRVVRSRMKHDVEWI